MLSEKIQWLKLYDNTPRKTELTDKLLAKKWVKSLDLPQNCLNVAEVYTEGKTFEDLDFDKCPERFVIKTNHASGQNIIIKNKQEFLNSRGEDGVAALGFDNVRKIFNLWLSRHYAFQSGFELQYKNIDRKVFVEEYIDDIAEYQFTCLNGVPEAIRYLKDPVTVIYSPNWTSFLSDKDKSKLIESDAYPEEVVQKPDDLDLMLEYARILSKEFKFVRVDFLKSNGKLYFAEMTFTPSSGIINDRNFDIIMGDKLKL